MIKKIVVILHIFFFNSVYSQDSLSIAKLLTNGNYKQWRLLNTITTLGGSTCVNGTYLVLFKEDQKVIQKDCDKKLKTWNISQGQWQLVKDKTNVLNIMLFNKRYVFRIKTNRKGRETLTLISTNTSTNPEERGVIQKRTFVSNN